MYTTMNGHAKCSKVFHHLEFGLLSFRHLITIRRLMFHHHILTRGDEELIKKVYEKQKNTHMKGDWYRTFLTDFEFIQEDLNEDFIKATPKEVYRKIVGEKVTKNAFNYYMEQKLNSKKKMKNLVYKELKIQPYLSNSSFTFKKIPHTGDKASLDRCG